MVAAFASACWAALTRYHWQQQGDDTFIYFRYARHVLDGHGPVWNPGYAVEGYSSPLWLGVVVGGGALGLDLHTWAGLVGVGLSATAVALCAALAWRLSNDATVAAVAALGASLVYGLHFWAPSGLETTLHTAAVLGTAVGLASGPRSWSLPAAFLGVARPEGPFLWLAAAGLAGSRHGRAALGGPALLSAVPTLGWLVFRLAYYGYPLPNTYYAKSTGPVAERAIIGLMYGRYAVALLAAATLAVWLARGSRSSLVAPLAMGATALAVVIGGGGDWMWHGRLLVPVVLTLVPVAVAAVATLDRPLRIAIGGLVAVVGLRFVAPLGIVADAARAGRLPHFAYQEGTLIPASVDAASYIAAHYPPDTVVAVNHAGVLGYELENPVLDMTGLNDLHIAHDVEAGLHQKFDPSYVIGRAPDLVVLNSRVRPDGVQWYHPGYWDGETALVEHPEFARRYRPVPVFWEWEWVADTRSYVLLYERIPDGSRP